MKTAFLFSGQGSQYVGMSKQFTDVFPKYIELFNTASDILDFDLREACVSGDLERLSKTQISQPAIMVTSIIAAEIAKSKGITFNAVAGHSLGEYAAMVESGMLTFEDGIKVIKARANAMGKAAKNKPGSMCAVLGITPEEVNAVCDEVNDFLTPVNYNSPLQTVIAGTTEAIDKAIEIMAERKIKAVKLNVSAAFHSKFMQNAADEFYEAIKGIHFSTPSCEFYSNVYGTRLTDFDDIPKLLAKHMVTPVLFTKELNEMQKAGYNIFIECGPNKVLTGLVKKTLKDAVATNIDDIVSLSKTIKIINELKNETVTKELNITDEKSEISK